MGDKRAACNESVGAMAAVSCQGKIWGIEYVSFRFRRWVAACWGRGKIPVLEELRTPLSGCWNMSVTGTWGRKDKIFLVEYLTVDYLIS